MEHENTTGHLAALLTIIIWGTTFISTKILLVDFQPVEILFSALFWACWRCCWSILTG
jgi:drug/metabolite transporter (DMT)-like permease